MRSIPGIKQIGRCNKGTLATTPAGIILCGLRDKATLKPTPFKTSKDVKDKQGRNMVQVAIDYESLQPTMKHLKANFDHMNVNCDVQLMTEKQSFTADSEDVLKFDASSFLLGLGFEYLISMEKRSMKETLKGAADYDVVKTLWDGSDTATAVVLNGAGPVSGEDETLRRRINFLAVEVPQSTALFEASELDDFKYSLKANTYENAYGQLCVDWITHKLEITMGNASVDKIVELMSKDVNASALIKLGNDTGNYDAFKFNAGAVNNHVEPDYEDKRQSKFILEGKVRPYEHLFEFGSGKGGASADSGLSGGTLTIG